MRTAIAMIFAGGRVEELSVLTERRPKSAVVFGGTYRTIDFALTNLADAPVTEYTRGVNMLDLRAARTRT